jgi:hypothetical protein
LSTGASCGNPAKFTGLPQPPGQNPHFTDAQSSGKPNTSAPKTTGAWDTTAVPHAPAKGDKNGLSELKVGIMLIFVICSS